jgi:hypothetical protein
MRGSGLRYPASIAEMRVRDDPQRQAVRAQRFEHFGHFRIDRQVGVRLPVIRLVQQFRRQMRLGHAALHERAPQHAHVIDWHECAIRFGPRFVHFFDEARLHVFGRHAIPRLHALADDPVERREPARDFFFPRAGGFPVDEGVVQVE